MAGLKRAAKIIAAGAVLDIGLLLYVVRACEVHPVIPSDPIFRSPSYRLLNPHHNPATQDEVVRRMPLAQVRDELLTPDGHLVEAFCGSVFGGTGTSLPPLPPDAALLTDGRSLRRAALDPRAQIPVCRHGAPALG
jgi:hypothetical protein